MDCLLNGKPVESRELLSLALYSYSVFSTFKIQDQKIIGLNYHFERLHRDAHFLFGIDFDEKLVRLTLELFCKHNDNCI